MGNPRTMLVCREGRATVAWSCRFLSEAASDSEDRLQLVEQWPRIYLYQGSIMGLKLRRCLWRRTATQGKPSVVGKTMRTVDENPVQGKTSITPFNDPRPMEHSGGRRRAASAESESCSSEVSQDGSALFPLLAAHSRGSLHSNVLGSSIWIYTRLARPVRF